MVCHYSRFWKYIVLYQGQNFFNSFMIKLTGTKELEAQIKAGLTEEEIKQSWREGLEQFKKVGKKYLLYPDF